MVDKRRFIGQHTVAGRVVYDRKKHAFTIKDAARILRHLNNDNVGDFFGWRAISRYANNQLRRFVEPEAPHSNLQKLRSIALTFAKINDLLVQVLSIISGVPGLGPIRWLCEGAIRAWELVKKWYPPEEL